MLFFLISTPQLEKQGLYYDELHQATASFAYVGQPPFQFAQLVSGGLPILNMNYSGALKTALYGLGMRVLDHPFSVRSWRLVGILVVGCGIFLFGLMVKDRLSWRALLLFYFLTLTDSTVVLATRHDWGPVALALFFRLLLTAVWLRGELSDSISPRNSLFLGALAGISIFEKLSNALLLLPLVMMFCFSPRRRTVPHVAAAAIGGLIGGSPLIYANVYSLITYGKLASLQFNLMEPAYSLTNFLSFISSYFSLGAGEGVRSFILGWTRPLDPVVELVFIVSLAVLILTAYIRSHGASKYFALAGVMLFCYLSIALGMYLLPMNTWVHHWIIGTPFQYAAIMLFLEGLKEKKALPTKGLLRWAGILLLAAGLIFRISAVTATEQSLLRGDASPQWDPSLTEMGQFAAAQSDQAIFITGSWGVANQMICFLNGERGIVFQPTWDLSEINHITNILQHSQKNTAYVVFLQSESQPLSEKNAAVLQGVTQTLEKEWREQPLEREIAHLPMVYVVKLERITPH